MQTSTSRGRAISPKITLDNTQYDSFTKSERDELLKGASDILQVDPDQEDECWEAYAAENVCALLAVKISQLKLIATIVERTFGGRVEKLLPHFYPPSI